MASILEAHVCNFVERRRVNMADGAIDPQSSVSGSLFQVKWLITYKVYNRQTQTDGQTDSHRHRMDMFRAQDSIILGSANDCTLWYTKNHYLVFIWLFSLHTPVK